MAFFGTILVGFSFTYDVAFYFIVVTFLVFPNVFTEFCAVAFTHMVGGGLTCVHCISL